MSLDRNLTILIVTCSITQARADAKHDLEQCQSTAKTLLEKLEAKGGSYYRTFDNWERDCVKNAELDSLPGFQDILAAHKKLRPIVDKAEAEYNVKREAKKLWDWVDANARGFDLQADQLSRLKPDSAEYKAAQKIFATCAGKFKELFAKYPQAAQFKHSEVDSVRSEEVLGDVEKQCAGGVLAKAAASRNALNADKTEAGLKHLMEKQRRFAAVVEALAAAKKASAGKYGAIQAAELLEFASRDASEVGAAVKFAAEYDENIRTLTIDFGGKKWLVRDLEKAAWAMNDQAKAAFAKLEGKAEQQREKWKAEAASRIGGDRKAVYKQHGMPDGFDGGDLADWQKRLDKLVSGSWWVYQSDGCELRFNFRGNTKVSRKMTPPGCTN